MIDCYAKIIKPSPFSCLSKSNKQTDLKAQQCLSVLQCLYVADPATSLALNCGDLIFLLRKAYLFSRGNDKCSLSIF